MNAPLSPIEAVSTKVGLLIVFLIHLPFIVVAIAVNIP